MPKKWESSVYVDNEEISQHASPEAAAKVAGGLALINRAGSKVEVEWWNGTNWSTFQVKIYGTTPVYE